jgi:nitrite reductase (NADH) small subunit
VGEFEVCLAHQNGKFAALDNWCPHRRGPLGEGWLEGNTVVCPWHAWAFHLDTGECPEEKSGVSPFPLKQQGDDLLIDIS